MSFMYNLSGIFILIIQLISTIHELLVLTISVELSELNCLMLKSICKTETCEYSK